MYDLLIIVTLGALIGYSDESEKKEKKRIITDSLNQECKKGEKNDHTNTKSSNY